MTIDERLEVLTHSVELIAQMQIKSEEERAKTQKEIRRLGRFVHIIVMDHESRLLDLEAPNGDEPDDEGKE